LSKEFPVCRKPKQVERQPEVESVCQTETSQSAESSLAATIRWVSGVFEGSPSQIKAEKKSKVSQKLGQPVSQKPASQLEVPWRPQLGGSVASSKEVQVSREPKQVESQPEVETVSQPETSQSAGSALAAAIRWASGVIEGNPSQPKSEISRKSARSRDSQSAKNQPVSQKCQGGSVSQKPASHLEVPWRPQLSRTVASS